MCEDLGRAGRGQIWVSRWSRGFVALAYKDLRRLGWWMLSSGGAISSRGVDVLCLRGMFRLSDSRSRRCLSTTSLLSSRVLPRLGLLSDLAFSRLGHRLHHRAVCAVDVAVLVARRKRLDVADILHRPDGLRCTVRLKGQTHDCCHKTRAQTTCNPDSRIEETFLLQLELCYRDTDDCTQHNSCFSKARSP